MRSRKVWSGILGLTSLALSSSMALADSLAFDAGSQCLPVLIPDTINDQSFQNKNDEFHEAYCGTWNADHSSDTGFDSGGTYLEVISGNLSGHQNTKQVDKTTFCSAKGATASVQTQIRFWSSRVSNFARAKFAECAETLAINHGDGPGSPIIVSVSNVGDGVVAAVRASNNVDLTPKHFGSLSATNLVCQPGLRKGALIPSAEAAQFSCAWENNYVTNGFVVLNDTQGRSGIGVVNRPVVELGKAKIILTHTETKVVGTNQICQQPELHTPWLHNKPREALKMNIVAPTPPVVWRDPIVHCLVNNQESCEWNGIGKPGSFAVLENTPDHLTLIEGIGSLDIHIQACATADQLGQVPVAVTGEEHPILRNTQISFMVPSGQTGQIQFNSPTGAASTIPVGTSSLPFFLANQTSVPGGTAYTYLLRDSPPRLATSSTRITQVNRK